jgi:2-polyprenyl-6-methoxyphenol hydroxylase-like FAD-dependent oxidoreductase
MWHLSGGRVYWVATIAEPDDFRVESGLRRGHILDRFASAVSPVPEVVKATDESAVLRNPVYDRVPVETWSSGRVTLLGDAAHPTTPVTGQGGGQAMIDAVVLSEQITGSGLADPARLGAALKSYEKRRTGVTTSITNEAWRISAMHHLTSPFMVWARDRSLKWTPTRVWNKRMEERLAF